MLTRLACRRLGIAAVLALAVLPLACGGESGAGAGNSGSKEGKPRVERRAWQRALTAKAARLLRVYYLAGPAFKRKRAEVKGSSSTVTITLLESPPGPGAHTAVGVIRCQEVRLERPLGDRRVIDGARGRLPREREDTLPPSLPPNCRPPLDPN